MALSRAGSSSGAGIVYQWSTLNGHFVSGATTNTATVDKGGTYQLIVRNSQSGCADTALITAVQTGKPVSGIALETKDAQCAADQNGQIVVGAVGSGTQPFTYSLNGGAFQNSNSFTGLKPDVYVVTVRGADGCQRQANTVIDAPDVLRVSIPVPGLLAEGATVDLEPVVSGAQGTLTYTWEGSNLSCDELRDAESRSRVQYRIRPDGDG